LSPVMDFRIFCQLLLPTSGWAVGEERLAGMGWMVVVWLGVMWVWGRKGRLVVAQQHVWGEIWGVRGLVAVE